MDRALEDRLYQHHLTDEEFPTRDDLVNAVALAKQELMEEISGLRYAKEIDGLHARVIRVEQKLGIKHSDRPA